TYLMIKVLIPAYNESKNIKSCLFAINKVLKANKLPHKFLIIDDGSQDNTLEILKQIKKELNLDIIEHKVNKGVAAAFSSGLAAVNKKLSDGDIIVITEADGTSDPKILPQMIERIKKGADIVIASRYKKGGKYKNFPTKRLFFSRSANLVCRVLYPLKSVRDYTIFYRAYSANVIKKSIKIYKSNLIKTKFFTANAEILIKMMKITKKIEEVAFVYDYSKKKGKSGLKIGKNLVQYAKLIRNSFLNS
ncbi:glycosyltransferase, partial [Candidatus Microgenomates bacterium]|nr:glycosyltransferase [Candidatus Microgenomates bacterium]